MSNAGSIRINVSPGLKQLKKVKEQLSQREIRRGISKSINQTLREGRDKAKEIVSGTHNIPVKYLNTIVVEESNESKMAGGLMADKKPLPLSIFRPTYFPGSNQGVRFNVLKSQGRIKFGFMFPGLRHVYGRGHYLSDAPYGFVLQRKGKKSGKDNGDVRRKNRRKKPNYSHPLTRLITVSVSGAMNGPENKKKLVNFIERRISEKLKAEMQRRIDKLSR